MFAHHKKIAGVIVGTCLFPVLSWAAELKDIQFAELPGEKVELKLQFDELPAEPSGYTIEKPARIVLDFADTENSLSQKKFTMGIGAVDGAVVVSSGGRTRLIINMNQAAGYSTRAVGDSYILEVGGGGASSENDVVRSAETPTAAAPIAQAVAPKKSSRFDASKSAITNIDFRRGEMGEGKVIVQLTNPNIGIDVEEKASGIEVSFMQTQLPEKLNRKLDVVDFATPVQMISTASNSVRTSLSIDANGDYDYLAYQADNEYVISVKPLSKAEQEEKRAKFAYTGEKLSLNFQNIEVRSVLQLIADVTELNLVASDTVKGSITLRLDNVPWDQALELVLKTKGLDKRQVGNVLMVAPAAEIAERERQELQTKKQLEELAPLRTEYIRIRYANARELFDLFVPSYGDGSGGAGAGGAGAGRASDRNSTASVLSERGSAIVDERTNSIILTDTEDKINEFRKIIEQVDIPIRQVMIEARIVIANNDFRKELGASIGGGVFLDSNRGGTKNVLTGSIVDADDIEYDEDTGTTTYTTYDFLNLQASGQSGPAGTLAWNIIKNNMMLGLEISALEDSGYAEVVSQPKVITGDKQQASIESGTEIPYRDASSAGGGGGGGAVASVSFKKALLRLDVTPQITPDDKVIMDLIINQDSRGQDTAAGPIIDTTKLETQVLVPDGQTVVLGGIFSNEVGKSQSKVPVLGDIPILGRLFRKDTNVESKRELLIFITPRIMSNGVND